MSHTTHTIGSTGVTKQLIDLGGSIYADAVCAPPILVLDEVVVAGASSVLGKIGTVAAGATLYVRVPCATTAPATSRANVRIQSDKAWAATFYRSRTVVNAPTITLASVQANDTVIVNGLTFTAHATTTTVASRQFSIAGTDIQDATELCTCINDATYGVPGLTAANSGTAVVTLTATTATTTQCVTGVGGARIVCAQTMPAGLEKINSAPHVTGGAANNTTAGTGYEVWVDGWPHIYIGLTNNDGSNAATFVVGGTLLAA